MENKVALDNKVTLDNKLALGNVTVANLNLSMMPVSISASTTNNLIYFYCKIMKETGYYKMYSLDTECIDVVDLFDDNKVF